MTDFNKAREWAERMGKIEGLMPGHRAAADLIQSLPDQWVDVEKLREEADRMDKGAENAMKPGHNEFSRGYAEAMQECAGHLRDLLTPSLPTLADMTQEEREACQWMQCKIEGFDKNLFIISTGSRRSKAVGRDGYDVACINSDITPLPDLSKLQWPDSAPKEPYRFGGTSAESDLPFSGVAEYTEYDSDQRPNTSEPPKSSIKPEDVPADELWLVEYRGSQWLAKRVRDWAMDFVWRLTSMTRGSHMAKDSEITLIHKLVPETHTLPEGMRLADHEKFGRVVTSPWGDGDDDYKIFFLNEDARGGADYDFEHESRLTFLDGEA